MSRFGVVTLIFGLAVLALVYFSLQGVNEYTCEVCVTYNGQTQCRTGQGRTKEDAVTKAQDAACSVMASGMDQRIACGNVEPTSVSCE